MKIIVLLHILLLYSASSGKDLYALVIENMDGTNTRMAEFHGKKILAFEFDASNPDKGLLLRMDSLFLLMKEQVNVIAVPATDFGDPLSLDSLNELMSDSLQLSFPISLPSAVKKNAGDQQHPLFKWLTHVSENNHFDSDIEEDGQMFVISEKGILFSTMNKQTPSLLIQEIISKQIPE